MSPVPLNKALYERTKRSAKKRFKVWPSARASQWLVREYKRKGGKYKGKKPGPKSGGLSRWQAERWIDVCKLPKKVPCGRPKSGGLNKWKKQYPYCRPSKRITSKTPRLASELTKAQIASRCKRKKSNPSARITGNKKNSARKKPTRKRRSTQKKPTRRRRSARKKPTRRRRSARKKPTRKRRSVRSKRTRTVKKRTRRKTRKPSRKDSRSRSRSRSRPRGSGRKRSGR